MYSFDIIGKSLKNGSVVSKFAVGDSVMVQSDYNWRGPWHMSVGSWGVPTHHDGTLLLQHINAFGRYSTETITRVWARLEPAPCGSQIVFYYETDKTLSGTRLHEQLITGRSNPDLDHVALEPDICEFDTMSNLTFQYRAHELLAQPQKIDHISFPDGITMNDYIAKSHRQGEIKEGFISVVAIPMGFWISNGIGEVELKFTSQHIEYCKCHNYAMKKGDSFPPRFTIVNTMEGQSFLGAKNWQVILDGTIFCAEEFLASAKLIDEEEIQSDCDW